MKRRLLFLAALLLPVPAFAKEPQFKAGDTVILEADKAYILARTYDAKGKGLQGTVRIAPILARLLSEDELRQAAALRESDPKNWKEKAPPNVIEMLPGQPFAQTSGQYTLLTAAQPGTYILAGVAVISWSLTDGGAFVTSLCLGTVKFEAKAGLVTDLGEILATRDDEPTTIPELAGIVTAKPSDVVGWLPYDVAVRPASASTPVPASLAVLPRAPADYRAMPPYPNYSGANINRLAPLSGVLDYDKDGDVIDLKAQFRKSP